MVLTGGMAMTKRDTAMKMEDRATLDRIFGKISYASGLSPSSEDDLGAALLAVRAAAETLLDDVRRRYPGEELRCPYMRILDSTVKRATRILSETPDIADEAPDILNDLNAHADTHPLFRSAADEIERLRGLLENKATNESIEILNG
jgi:hypothetical protein